MESMLYTLNLTIHIVAAVGCAAAPYYQLRMVKMRGKYGTDRISYEPDDMIERILSFQPRLCLVLIIVLILTGMGFPAIDYGFHGHLLSVTTIDWYVGTVKTVLAFIGLGVVAYGITVVDPKIQGLFATFSPETEPDSDNVAKFWALRRHRKKVCQLCFSLALLKLLITPVLRFY